MLREGEYESVVQTMRASFHLNLIPVDARKLFIDGLAGATDPEKKRKIHRRKLFIDVFDEHAEPASRTRNTWCKRTLYPDVIESVSVKGPSAVIKSHHNVGGLPENMNLKLIEPLRELFKDEVRAVGEALGMPHDVLWRHSFLPGPGCALPRGFDQRTPVDVLRKADAAIVDEELRAANLYSSVWQAFAVLLPVRSVGVMGDDPHLRRDDRDPRRAIERRHDRRLGALAARGARQDERAHHQRGPRHQPCGVRHQLEAARRRSSGNESVSDAESGVAPGGVTATNDAVHRSDRGRRAGTVGTILSPTSCEPGVGRPAVSLSAWRAKQSPCATRPC